MIKPLEKTEMNIMNFITIKKMKDDFLKSKI